MKKIAIIGAGGFGQEVYCIWRDQLQHEGVDYEFVGFYDDADNLYENKFGKVIGNVDSLNNIDFEIEVAIGIGNSSVIKKIKEKINNSLVKFPNIIHPSVRFLDFGSTKLGVGNIISLGVLMSCNINIGDFNVFNTNVNIGHDNNTGNFNVFSPNTQIMGNVTIENFNFFGFSCGVLQGKKIGNNNVIGAGAILLRSIKDEGTYVGVPAVKMKF